MRRKVTVDSTQAAHDSTESRRPSVFERLGPGSSRENSRDGGRADQCRNWVREGSCTYGNTCRFQHGPRNKSYGDRSPESDPVDLRHRVESKRAERERERDRDRSPSSSLSPPLKDKMKYKGRREKESTSDRKRKGRDLSGSRGMKSGASPPSNGSEPDEWGGIDGIPAADDDMWDDEASLDYRQALTLEMKRQQIQRELQQMEEEEEAREQAELILQKETSDDNAGGPYRSSRSPSPIKKKHSKKKKGRSKAEKQQSPSPEEHSPPAAYNEKKRKRRKSEETIKHAPDASVDSLHKKKTPGSSHSPRLPKAATFRNRSPSPHAAQQRHDSDSDLTPRKYKGKSELRKKSKEKDVVKRRSFSRNRSTDKDDLSKRKPARSQTPPAQYRKMVTPSKRPRSPSRSPTPTKRKMKRFDSPTRSSRRPPSPPTPSHSDSSHSGEGSSPSSSSSAPSESPRSSSVKRPRYQSPSPRQHTKQVSPARDRRARPRSPLPQSQMSGRAGLKKQQHRSMSPSSSHRSYSPASKRQSPSPRSGRRLSPSNSTKHSQIGMSRSDSGSREHRQRKQQERLGSDNQFGNQLRGERRGDQQDDYQRSRVQPEKHIDPRMNARSDSRQRSDARSDPRAESRGPPQMDPRAYQRGDQHNDPRGVGRANPRGDVRGDPRGNMRVDPRGDPRGDPRTDVRRNMRGDLRADPRGDPRGDLMRGEHRGDQRGNLRGEPRGNVRGDLRGDPRGDQRGAPRGNSRDDLGGDPRGNPRDPRDDPRGNPRDQRGEPRGDPRMDLRSDPLRRDLQGNIRADPRAGPRADSRGNQRVEPRIDPRDMRGRPNQQERESRRDEWERRGASVKKEPDQQGFHPRDPHFAPNRGLSQESLRDMMPRSGSLDNRQGHRSSPSPVGRGRGPNFGRAPERDLGPERRDRGQEKERGPQRGRESVPQRDGRGPDLGRGNQRGKGQNRSMDRGKGPEFSKGNEKDKFQERGGEPQRGRDGELRKDTGFDKNKDTRGGSNRGRALDREGYVRQDDHSFEESQTSRDSSADSRHLDKLKSSDLKKGALDSVRLDQGKRANSKDRRDNSRSRERQGDSRGSSSSWREKPEDRDKNQRSERSSEKSGRDFPKKAVSVDGKFVSDSSATTHGRGDRSQSCEKPNRDQEQRSSVLESKVLEALSRSSTQDSKESTPLKEGSPVRPSDEVFSDWSEGGSDELLNQSPPVEERNLPTTSALESVTTKRDSLSEPPKKDKHRVDKRSEDRDKQEGVEGRSLRSLSNGSSSSRYSSISSVLLGQNVPTGSLDQGFVPKTGPGQEDEGIASSLDKLRPPAEDKMHQGKGPQDKNSGLPAEGIARPEQGTASNIYEVISDDELDDILEDGDKEDPKPEEDIKVQEDVQADLTAVDWSSLMAQTPLQTEKKATEEAGSILDKFRPGQVLARVGISRALAGPELMKEVEKICLQASEEEGSHIQVPLFESQLGAFNATSQRKLQQRRHLLSNIGPCRRALCARRDVMIRRQLGKVDKPEPDQVFSTSLLDAELFKLNVQLFKAVKKSQVPDQTPATSTVPGAADRNSPIVVCM